MNSSTGPRARYGPALARVHHEGYADHAESTAPGILELLGPVRARDGLVLEIGCGSGVLTRHLLAAGHRVLATDASAAMLEIARSWLGDPPPGTLAALTLPDDPVPAADAIVGVGHVLNYLADLPAVLRALEALAAALRPGGVLVLDVCDLEWGRARAGAAERARVTDDWAIITRFRTPTGTRFVRDITTFTRAADGRWVRDDEVHENVLVDVTGLAERLRARGLDVELGAAFGAETLPPGLRTLVARRP